MICVAHKKIYVSIIISAGIIFGAFLFSKYSRGQGLLPFGGRVISAIPCTCNGVFLLTVSAPVGGQFTYIPGTQDYESFNLGLDTGMWALGLYTPNGAVCLMDAAPTCVPFGAPLGTITPTVGTSLAF